MDLVSEIFDVYPIQRHVSSLLNCQYQHHNSRDFFDEKLWPEGVVVRIYVTVRS